LTGVTPSSGSELPSGTLTFLFADIEGSTPMLERLGEDYRGLLHTYHSLVNAAVAGHGGRTAATEGDGFFCVFPSPLEAVETAHDICTAMERAQWPGDEHPRCRIGIHTGTAVRTMEGYVGLDVHRAARIGAAANGGQVLLSASTAAIVEDHVGKRGWSLLDLGEFRLEGINREERLLRLEMPDLPSITTVPRARARPRFDLPTTPRPIVGRVDDLRVATQMILRDSVRLVTITGPGGTGKTRLAVEIAARLESEFPDGIVFVDLSSVRARSRFLPTVGLGLGVRESTERGILDGLNKVVGASRMLLVLDNLEQLLGVGPDISRLLETLPNIRILATSRSPLKLTWETEYPLSPLPVPDPTARGEAIAEADSVALFMQRARVVRPDFPLDDETGPAVAEITRRLDGLPLAIELAAARLRAFSVEELLERLDDRLDLLDRGASDAPERHRTLRAAIQWSHDLLSPAERMVFRRLAVFAGGWTLEAAVCVCRGEELSEGDILDVLEELVAKSLVVFAVDDHGRPRYRMLETLREFSLEKLVEEGEERVVRRRHLDWCHSMAERMGEFLATPRFPVFLDEIELERANLRAALRWSLASGEGLDAALAICGDLPLFWDTRGYVTEGVELTTRVVRRTEGNSVGRGMALAALGWLQMLAGDPDGSELSLSTSVAMFRELGEDAWLCRALSMQGMTTYNRNDLDGAERQFVEAIELARRNDLEWLADAWCAYGMAHVALARGDFERCLVLLEGALEYSRDKGLTWGVGHTQLSLGALAFMMGDIDQALHRLSESTQVRRELKDARGICDCLGMIALLASARGDHEFAALMLGVAEMAREASGHQVVPWLQPLMEEAQMIVQQALKDLYEAKLEEGRTLPTDEAIQMILDRFQTPEAAVPVIA
jgi:predicted ATPase/class 3 adenylate cyclase